MNNTIIVEVEGFEGEVGTIAVSNARWECELASAARLNRLLRDLSRRRTALEAT